MFNADCYKSLIELIYTSAGMIRWNGVISPVAFYELDKQAHKMFIAFLLAKTQEEKKGQNDWARFIEGSLFELLRRIILTDIKPELYDIIMKEKGPEINEWVSAQLESITGRLPGGMSKKMRRYFFCEEYSAYEKKILKAAHLISTLWELDLIIGYAQAMINTSNKNRWMESMMNKLNQAENFSQTEVSKLNFINYHPLSPDVRYYNDFVGMLRQERRWSSTAFRIPQTSVLGHSYIVAMLSYLFTLEISDSSDRLYNNFVIGLFHDLPEAITGDIATPIKKMVKDLDKIINRYEFQVMQKEIINFPEVIAEEIMAVVSGNLESTFSPCDYELVKLCDSLSGHAEAVLCAKYGVVSPKIEEGLEHYKDRFDKEYRGIPIGEIFKLFSHSI